MNPTKKLHFGCFDQVIPGWVNTDITHHIWIARVPFLAGLLWRVGLMPQQRFEQHRDGIFRNVVRLDLRRRFPFGDGEFACAFSAHVLEHLFNDEALACLKEVHRVLAPGGILRVSVPDLDRCIGEYDPQQPDEFCAAMYESRQARDKNRHHWMYNEKSMGQLLREAGFAEVWRCQFREGRCPEVEAIDNRPESLFMEARK